MSDQDLLNRNFDTLSYREKRRYKQLVKANARAEQEPERIKAANCLNLLLEETTWVELATPPARNNNEIAAPNATPKSLRK